MTPTHAAMLVMNSSRTDTVHAFVESKKITTEIATYDPDDFDGQTFKVGADQSSWQPETKRS